MKTSVMIGLVQLASQHGTAKLAMKEGEMRGFRDDDAGVVRTLEFDSHLSLYLQVWRMSQL